jgi:hypothetical protein
MVVGELLVASQTLPGGNRLVLDRSQDQVLVTDAAVERLRPGKRGEEQDAKKYESGYCRICP